MDRTTLLFVIAAALGGFIGGFLLANSLNRSEMNSLRSQAGSPAVSSSASTTVPSPDEATLSEGEIQAKISEADKNAGDFAFQKNLGVSLYRYGAMKSDPKIITESARILTRANSLDPKDFDVLVSLGNALFDIGFANKDLSSFQKARDNYSKALAIRPDDVDVRTDVGISYLVQEPPEYAKAASELEAVSKAHPGHARSMQFLARAYLKQGRVPDAERLLAEMKGLDPSSTAIEELAVQISAAKNAK